MSEDSPPGAEIGPRRTIDKLHTYRFVRVFTPIWMVLALGWLVQVIVTKGDAESVVFAALRCGVPLLFLIRIRRPMHTWPEWLFSYRP